MDDQTVTLCTSKEAICAALSPHAAHCSTVSEGGMPCVRGHNHAGDVHAYGVPSGVAAPVRGQKHGSGAPPAPRPAPLAARRWSDPFTPEERAAFNRYAQGMRDLGKRHGFDFGPDGSKVVAGVVLLLKVSFGSLQHETARPPRKGKLH